MYFKITFNNYLLGAHLYYYRQEEEIFLDRCAFYNVFEFIVLSKRPPVS